MENKRTKKLIKDVDVADLYGIPLQTVRRDRYTFRRIPFIQFGDAVWYDPDKVEAAFASLSIGGPQPDAPPLRPRGRPRKTP